MYEQKEICDDPTTYDEEYTHYPPAPLNKYFFDKPWLVPKKRKYVKFFIIIFILFLSILSLFYFISL